jgi:hypothetical protein
MIEWVTFVALGALWGLGWLVLAGVEAVAAGAPHATRFTRARGALESHSLAVLLGITTWAFGLIALGHGLALDRLPPALGWIVGGACTVAGAWLAWTRVHRPGPLDKLAREPWTALDGLALGVALLLLAFAVFYASTMPVHIFDPVFHFAFKGKLLYHEGLMGPGWTDVEGPIGRVITHPDYPPGVGAIEALVAWPKGQLAIHAARPLMSLFVLATAGFLWSRLAEHGRRTQVLGVLLWASLPFLFYSRLPHPDWAKGYFGLLFGSAAGEARYGSVLDEDGVLGRWTEPDGWTLDGAGDLPLAALFSVGAWLVFAALARGRRGPSSVELVLGGLLLGGGALMKNEGLALLPVALFAAAIAWLLAPKTHTLKSWLQAAAVPLGIALVVASPWLLVRGSVPTIGEDYPSRLSPAGLVEAARAEQAVGFLESGQPETQPVPKIVASGFAEAIAHVPRFGLLWLALFGAVLVRWRTTLRPLSPTPATAATWTILGAFALYALVLLVTPWNLTALFKTAIPDRLIFHVAPLAILVVAIAFAPKPAPNAANVPESSDPVPSPQPSTR